MEYTYSKYPVNVEQIVDEILSATGLIFSKLNTHDISDGSITYADSDIDNNFILSTDVVLSQQLEDTITGLIDTHVCDYEYKQLDWSRRRDTLLPHFYAEAGAQLQNFAGLVMSKKLNACCFFIIPYSIRIQVITDTNDAKNWDFLLTKTKESRISCVEAMRVKVGQYMRVGTITLTQTQDFYTQVYEKIFLFNNTNKPDLKMWITNEIGSVYENAGFAQMTYYNVDIKNDLMSIYNGNY